VARLLNGWHPENIPLVSDSNFRTRVDWCQLLGYEKVLTTFVNYGAVACERQSDILRSLATPQLLVQSGVDEMAEAIFQKFRDFGLDVRVK
jgi:hypothetical protein